MVSINGTTITMTRGDTAVIDLTLTDVLGNEYDPLTTDVIRLAAKENYTDSEVLIYRTAVVNQDTNDISITIEPSDTKFLDFGTYVYDLQLTKATGVVDTFMSGELVLTEEVE